MFIVFSMSAFFDKAEVIKVTSKQQNNIIETVFTIERAGKLKMMVG